MNLADVNVLVGAFRRDSAHHDTCRAWLNNTINHGMPFAVSPLALAAVVRITTNPRIFRTPSAITEAFAFCDNLLNQPDARVVEPGERHWEIFKQLCAATGLQGARTSDAWYAALSIESHCEWVTLDGDYARFRGLKWRRL
jgi:toxin-antitoxin system PIN domain toxin